MINMIFFDLIMIVIMMIMIVIFLLLMFLPLIFFKGSRLNLRFFFIFTESGARIFGTFLSFVQGFFGLIFVSIARFLVSVRFSLFRFILISFFVSLLVYHTSPTPPPYLSTKPLISPISPSSQATPP